MLNTNSIRKLLLGLLGFFICLGCERDCFPAEGRLELVGFTAGERNSIILKSYPKGAGFQKWTDSVFIDGSNCNCFLRTDTFEISPFINNLPGLRSQFDYEVSLPGANKAYRITSITENKNSVYIGAFSKVGCMNSINSYELDGVPFLYPVKGSVIFINR